MKNTRKIQRILFSFLIVAMLLPASSFAATKQKMKIEFINVGAGDAIYIETPNGTDILIDAGTTASGAAVVDQLFAQEPGMTLEYVISTHPDADHAGGLQEVFKRMKVKRFYYPKDVAYSTITAQRVLALAKAEPNCIIKNATPGTVIKSGGAKLEFVHSKKDYKTSNQDSVMTFIDYGNLEVLLTGDVEKGAEAAGKAYNVDVLQAPHHGSKYSSSASFIEMYDPERIVISTDGRSYGHPHQEALARYAAYDSSIGVYRTDESGNIKIYANGKKWWFSKADIRGSLDRYRTFSSIAPFAMTPVAAARTVAKPKASKTVYVTKTGSRYHYSKKCRGLKKAKSIKATKLSLARKRGLTLCKFERK